MDELPFLTCAHISKDILFLYKKVLSVSEEECKNWYSLLRARHNFEY